LFYRLVDLGECYSSFSQDGEIHRLMIFGGRIMEYMLLIYSDETDESDLTPEGREAALAPYIAFSKEVRERGMYVTGSEAQPSSAARTVRVRGGNMFAADGPFALGKEQFGGFFILKCQDIDEACAIAAKLPGAARGAVEVRPLVG
jgi:hypothetical protein